MTKERYTRVRSKNYSCASLRHNEKGIGPFPIRSLVRFGSTTPTEMIFPKSYGKYDIIEVNSVESIQNSRSKLLMKECFATNKVKQSEWALPDNKDKLNNMKFPLLAKRIFGYKGKGMVKLDNLEQLEEFIANTNLEGYYFEKFFNGSREYRLHVAEDGCFMSWRKLRKKETPDDKRWYFNSDYCNWVGETHDLFNKPANWDNMVNESVKALKSVGLDIGCVDLRCQSSGKTNPEFIIVEINSAPSLAEQGVEAYREKIYDIINDKINTK